MSCWAKRGVGEEGDCDICDEEAPRLRVATQAGGGKCKEEEGMDESHRVPPDWATEGSVCCLAHVKVVEEADRDGHGWEGEPLGIPPVGDEGNQETRRDAGGQEDENNVHLSFSDNNIT